MANASFNTDRKFPGTEGSGFDLLVRLADVVERIPALLFAPLLFLLALIPTRADLPRSLGLWAFTLGDWMLLAALPHAGRSFGPAKPPTLLLAGLRLPAVAILPLPWSLGLELIGTILVIYGFWIEPHRLTLTRQSLHTAKLQLTTPLRVMHLGDLHVERVTGRERQLLALVRETKPDLILFSGDFLNLSNVHDPGAWEQARSILCQLDAPLGVFTVTGSPPVDRPEVIPQLLNGLPLRWLRDEKVTLEHHGQPIDIVGITCTHNPTVDAPRLISVLAGDDPEHFTILLYHTPDLAPEAAAQGIDLQLSGHTHGGQVRLPFFGALYTSSLYGKRFESGRCQVRQLTLYVTRGIGLEGKGAPRVRFLCPPEVILWEINGAAKSS